MYMYYTAYMYYSAASQLADRCPQRRALPGGARTSRLVAMAVGEVVGVGVVAKEADC